MAGRRLQHIQGPMVVLCCPKGHGFFTEGGQNQGDLQTLVVLHLLGLWRVTGKAGG